MKNLFAIPRLSLTETFTILITLVVCLVDFANAEVYSNHRKRSPNQREKENFLQQKAPLSESVTYSHETPKISNELEEKNFANLRNLPEAPLDKLYKRNSDYFDESDDADSEKEGDGYGYDDDEYYHFNFKRNDEISGGNENIKSDKEAAGASESNDKDALKNDKHSHDLHKGAEKETETIEMLNFKETHTGGNGGSKSANKKPYSDEPHQKPYNGETTSSLKVSDLRENSAIDEKIKERKDSGGGLATDQKLGDSTTGPKSDEKDALKLKDLKLTEDSEKKEKELSFKDSEQAVESKDLKEATKASEESEKNAKLNESEETMDKMDGKSKEQAKVAKDEEESSNFSEKLNADGLSELNSRTGFESNDYKESVDALKIDEEEKNSYEAGAMEKTIGLDDYQEANQPRERKKKQYKVRESREGERLKGANGIRDDGKEAFRDENKMNEFLSGSRDYDTVNVNPKEFFKKSQFWKDVGLRDGKSRQQQKTDQTSQEQQEVKVEMLPQMQTQPSQNSIFDVKNPFGVNTPRIESENGDFRKNYAKSLKRFKSFGEDSKGLPFESSRAAYERMEEPAKNWRSSGIAEGDGNAQNKYSNSKRDVQESKQRQVYPCEYDQFSPHKGGSALREDKNEEHHASGRLRRKSPQKLEYEIKVINNNKDEPRGMDHVSHHRAVRVEKDVKSKIANDDKYLKKYPYSQVSRDDLTRLNKVRGSEKFGKNKRKAPILKRHEQKSNIQVRAVPFGYYSNRVKFGQKSYRNNENNERSRLGVNSMMVPFVGGQTAGLNQKEDREEDFKHDTAKRFDDSGSLNKGNSLLLVKKDERVTKSFEESNSKSGSDNDYTSDALAKILAKDNDFLILKRTESNKFQKVSETDNGPMGRMESMGNQISSDITFGRSENVKPNSKQGLQAKPVHSDKEDKKFASNLHGTNSKLNLKKTFDKFRDLAGFFKENEQEPADNPVREVKEGRDIVFSEDKLPDPIVISSDPGEKFSAYKTKPQNSIYSISTNFKALDQQEKRKELHNSMENRNTMLNSAAGKTESSELSWEPNLRNMFPEAKTINATSRNGNEIIVLDLNRNQLRRDHQFYQAPNKQTPKQLYAPFGSTAQIPINNNPYPASNQYPSQLQLPGTNQYPTGNQYPTTGQFPINGGQFIIPGNRRIQILLDEGGSMQQEMSGAKAADKTAHQQHTGARGNEEGKGYTVFTSGENQAKIILPFSDVNSFSSLIKNIFDKKDSFKLKKSAEGNLENKATETFNRFLKDLGELSDAKEKEGKKEAVSDKRNPITGKVYVNTVKQLPGEEETIKYLGNLLQNLILTSDAQAKTNKDQTISEGNVQYPEEGYSGDAGTGQWSSVEEKGRDQEEFSPKAEDTVGLLQSEASMPAKTPEDELWEELAAASDKIHRSRREGKGKRKRKALSLRQHESKEGQSESSFLDSQQSEGSKDEDGLTWAAKLKDDEPSRESTDAKTRFETHLKQFLEGLNENKNQKEHLFVPNESARSRKKRKDTRRRKRSAWSDVKNKVSTTAVENTILKKLAEDNYNSVYSPGIKRRLLSTDIEAEDADSYSDENERDKNVIAEEPQTKCVKNCFNECVDPIIVELFRSDMPEEKNRARRSLTSEFHSDYKREIDLDESMPNDFQNFLVTSLGAFGSQKREVVKKDEALGEGKESFPDTYNRGKETTEDSALEKREVSSDDNLNYKKYYNADEGSNLAPSSKTGLKNTPGPADDNLPTHIRIQVTNANAKEKNFKPIMDDSETTFADVESEPKDKELFDKANSNPFRKNNLSKFRHYSLNRYEYSGEDGQGSSALQSSYHPYRRRLKKKKYNVDSSAKQEFVKFDHKPMEGFPRRVIEEPNLVGDHTTQKSAVSNHLPQVETVYNPTQGTNKAQLEAARLGKANSVSNKNTATARTMDSVERTRTEDGMLRSYLKEHGDKVNCNKMKDWNPPNSGFGQEFEYKSPHRDNLLGLSTDNNLFYNPYKQKYYTQRRNSDASFVVHFPKDTVTPYNLYDALKARQEMKNRNRQKPYQRTCHTPGGPLQPEGTENTQNPYSKQPQRGGSVSVFDKKQFGQWRKTGEHYTPPLQGREGKSKVQLAGNDLNNPLSDPWEGPMDGSKEQDYPDSLEDDYGSEDSTKDGQFDERLTALRKSKVFENQPYHRAFGKNADVDDVINEDEEEVDEDEEEMDDDYEENTEEDDREPSADGEYYSGIGTNPLTSYSYSSPKDNLPNMEDKFAKPEMNVKFSEGDPRGDTETKSTSVLRKLNENANILGENLLQHMHGLAHGDVFLGMEKIHQPEVSKGERLADSKRKRKLELKKRSRDPPEIGNRFIYAAKNEFVDSDVKSHPKRGEKLKSPMSNYRLTKEHFLDAQFAGPGNDYENESEEKYQVNFAKNGFSQKVADETEDVKENLEDDGETISEDNILENVIGKYIMRKTVKAATDQAAKRSANGHELRKRSAESSERVPKAKVVRRRLSSGHLTESNFRKYHKKKLARKRQVQKKSDTKRSAMDLLKKLTSKDRDKKGDTPVDSRTAGFEPLFEGSFKDKKLVSIADSKHQEKKLTGGAAEVKNGLTDHKYPLPSVGLIEKKKSKMVVGGSSSRVQGPWKIELNDKCSTRTSDASLKSNKKGVSRLASSPAEEPKSLKAFLVIGKNAKSAKIYSEALPSASGAFLKAVGRLDSEGGTKKYNRKRYSIGGAGKASGGVNERGEGVNADKGGNTKSGAGQPSQGLQRNSKTSFVTADGNSRFFTNGRLVKRKPAFPPSNDANIIRDSRHVKDETSEYLGQQVVNAILSHVSANPRFKEMIAPGLAPRTPNYKQENYDKDNSLHQVDFPDHLQYFLQRFMYDLEKLAERRVKKRMCNQIDKQAKQFLEFLLSVPTENIKSKGVKDDICPMPVLTTRNDDERDSGLRFYNSAKPECTTEARIKPIKPLPSPEYTPELTTPESVPDYTPEYTPECTTEHDSISPTALPMPDCQQDSTKEHRSKSHGPSEGTYRDLKAEIDNLRKKCCVLLKLIVDYQNLSKLEREILDSKYHSIMQQLDRINQEIKSAKANHNDTPESQAPPNGENLCCGYNVGKNPQPKNSTHDNESDSFQTTTEGFGGGNKKPKQLQKKKLPRLYFEEMKNPAEPDIPSSTGLPVFERVSVGKLSELRKETKEKPAAFEMTPHTTLAPNSFDLLLCANNNNSTLATDDSNPIMTTTRVPTATRRPLSKKPSGQLNTAEGDSQTMFIPAIDSGSNVHPKPGGRQKQERKKRKKFTPHLPGRRAKRSNWKGEGEFKKQEVSAERSSDQEEYTGWSSIPAVRRILNNLESGFEFDELIFKKPKRKKLWRRGEKKPD